MCSSTTKNDAFKNSIEENELEGNSSINSPRPSLVPRQISFSQREATIGEIILVILPYLILLIDVLIFFLLRGFKLTPLSE